MLVIFSIFYLIAKRKKSTRIAPSLFLASWLFSHLSVVTVGGTTTPFLMVGIGPAVSIVLAIFIFKLWERKAKILSGIIVAVIVFGNLSMIYDQNPKGSTLFAIQKDMLLSKQLQIIDYTYEKSDGNSFSVNTLNSPLWINIVWSYLYDFYGEEKYGYAPCYSGRNQIGQVGSLDTCEEVLSDHFLILEPMGGIPTRYLNEILEEEDSFSLVVEEYTQGELRVQKREAL